MRLIFLICLASLFGFGLLQLNSVFPDSLVKVYLGNYLVELNVVLFLILILVIVLVTYFLLWLFRTLWRSPKSVSRWWHRRSRNIAEEQFGAGYLSLIKGDWRRAESQLTKRTEHSHISYVNYLAAARAAAEQGRLSKRDEYLQAAYKSAPQERLAIGLTKAKLHERAGQIEEALATLEDIRGLGNNNPQYTAMLLQTYERTQNWSGIKELLPTAKKQKALPEEALISLRDIVVTSQLQASSDKSAAFKGLPRDQRKRLNNVAIYARSLVHTGGSAEAEKLIRGALKSEWSNELVDIYGELQTDKPAKLLRQVEGWLMARPENAHLNLAAGRLAQQAKSLETAKEYLQKAIAQEKLAAAYSVLGEVYEANNESGKALQLYRVGMQAMAGEQTDEQQSEAAPDLVNSEGELISVSAAKSLPTP